MGSKRPAQNPFGWSSTTGRAPAAPPQSRTATRSPSCTTENWRGAPVDASWGYAISLRLLLRPARRHTRWLIGHFGIDRRPGRVLEAGGHVPLVQLQQRRERLWGAVRVP